MRLFAGVLADATICVPMVSLRRVLKLCDMAFDTDLGSTARASFSPTSALTPMADTSLMSPTTSPSPCEPMATVGAVVVNVTTKADFTLGMYVGSSLVRQAVTAAAHDNKTNAS